MTKVIDYWTLPFPPQYMKRMAQHPDFQPMLKWWHQEDRYKGYSVEEMVAFMDEGQVEWVGVPSFKTGSYQYWDKPAAWDVDSEGLAKELAKRPDRFFGLHGINPRTRMEGVRALERAVKDLGFKGAHVHCYGFGIPLNHRDYWPFYAKCVELDIPVVMQVGHSAEFMPNELARPMLVDDITLYFPELKIVCAHTGWPWVEEAIALAWKHPNVYIGTSAHMPRYWDKSLVAFMNTRGAGKVLFGTDWPVVPYKEGVDQVAQLGLKAEAKEQLMRGAALKVFKL